jgi:YHS domain-containing protein
MGQKSSAIVGNMICPVSGQSVKSMGKPYQVENNEKVYNLCCKGCAETFKKDPEKYIKIVEKELKK